MASDIELSREDMREARKVYMESANSIQLAAFQAAPQEKQEDIIRASVAHAIEVNKRLPPAGSLNLPKLLDRRRLEYGIVARAFTHHQAMFDAVLVYQLPQFEGDTFGGGNIVMPDTSKKGEQLESARCIVVSAGLKALDELRSHGVDLGHIVYVCKHTPLRQRIDVVNGKPEYLLMIRPGDIVASEDLAKAYATGHVKTVEVLDEKTGAYVHQVQLKNEETGEYEAPRKALMPWISDDL